MFVQNIQIILQFNQFIMERKVAIICAYNEEKTIRNVLIAILNCKIFNEIVIVNDGSNDNTKEIINEFVDEPNILVINIDTNKGKGYAMSIGIENSTSDYIVFIDADLTEISAKNLKAPILNLLSPLINNEVDMALGQPFITILNYKINPFKSLTGERAVKRIDILPLLEKMKESRFGVETLINLYYQASGKIVKYILMPELDHKSKFSKTNKLSASKQYIVESQEIILSVFKNYELMIKNIKNILFK